MGTTIRVMVRVELERPDGTMWAVAEGGTRDVPDNPAFWADYTDKLTEQVVGQTSLAVSHRFGRPRS